MIMIIMIIVIIHQSSCFSPSPGQRISRMSSRSRKTAADEAPPSGWTPPAQSGGIFQNSCWSLEVLNTMLTRFVRNRDPFDPKYESHEYEHGR